MSDGLAAFLLARIAEDEATARFHLIYQQRDRVRWSTPWDTFNPARVLAECDAHRRIVEYHADGLVCDWTLRLLALPFVQHPEFRREWLP